jgi:hypothetical protein
MCLITPCLHFTTTYCALLWRAKQKTWRVCEGKTTCHIFDVTHIAPCGPPPIANLYCTLQSSQHFCDIFHKENFATRSVSVHLSDISHFATFSHTQNIAHFMIQNILLKTLRVTRNRKLALFSASHFAFEYVSQTSSQIFTKLSGGGRIASCNAR